MKDLTKRLRASPTSDIMREAADTIDMLTGLLVRVDDCLLLALRVLDDDDNRVRASRRSREARKLINEIREAVRDIQ